MSPVAAGQLVTDAVNLRHRHPRLWVRVGALEAEAWKARKIAHETHRLSFERAGGWMPTSPTAAGGCDTPGQGFCACRTA